MAQSPQDPSDGLDPLSQDDIDAALNEAAGGQAGADASADAEAPPQQPREHAAAAQAADRTPEPAEAQASGDLDPLSQEEIDAAMNGATTSAQPPEDLKAAARDAALKQAATQDAHPAGQKVDQSGRPYDAFAAAMAEAIATDKPDSPPGGSCSPPDGAAAVDLPQFSNGANGKSRPLELDKLQLIEDVQLHVRIELGRTRMLVEDVLRLDQGSVVELDKLAGDPVDIYVNERLVAHGEVLVLNDNFCVRVNEIVSSPQEMSV